MGGVAPSMFAGHSVLCPYGDRDNRGEIAKKEKTPARCRRCENRIGRGGWKAPASIEIHHRTV